MGRSRERGHSRWSQTYFKSCSTTPHTPPNGIARKLPLGSVEVNGYFGENTEMGVKYLQGWNGQKKDGRCGTATWARVDAYPAI